MVLSSAWVLTTSIMLRRLWTPSLKLPPSWMKRTCHREGRTAVLSPRQYYALISQTDTNILNTDFGTAAQGSMNTGEGHQYSSAGIKIRRSNNLPFLAGTVSSSEGENNNYAGDFSNHAGLIYYRDAAAVVEAIGPSIQTSGSDVKTMYQGDQIVGRLAMGAWYALRTLLLLSNCKLLLDT